MRRLLVAASLLSTLSFSALAHSPVNTSQPADGASLQSVPEALVLTLAEPGRFMMVQVTHTSSGTSTSHMEVLDIPSRDMTERMEFSAPDFGAGTYLVEWRVLGKDGHAMDGTVTYTVTPE